MRSHWQRLAVLLALPFVLSGCVFGLGCELFGSFIQKQMPQADVCGAFTGDCCGDDDGDGLPEECSTPFGSLACGRFDTFGCGCTVGGGFTAIGQTLLPELATYALPPNAFFDLRTPIAGLSSAHRVFFDILIDTLQTYRAVVTYPDAFGFNGFLALGPPETQIGAYGVDFNLDFVVDLSLPLRALTTATAYVDADGSGGFNAADPVLQYTPGSHVFTTTLPRGGDGLARLKFGRTTMRVTVALYAGVLTNPASPSDYPVTGSFTSVDPDSGDADDGANQAPTSFSPTPEIVTIFPSGLEGLSPFLCYKGKPSKGLLCAGSAATNAGGLCASDADCGGAVGTCIKTPLAKGLTVNVDDQANGLGPRNLTIAKAASLCTPAEINATGQPSDAATHLRGYQVKPAKGTPKHEPLTLMPIANQLGTVIVDTKKPDRLLAPSAKSLGGPAAPLGSTAIDHFSCYTLKTNKKRCALNAERKCKKSADCGVDGPCLTSFPKNLSVQIGDQFTGFGTPKTLAIVKPTRLCFAADVNGSGTNGFAVLLCYKTKPAGGAPKHEKIVGQIHTTNAIARERADTVTEDEICLPSVLTGVS